MWYRDSQSYVVSASSIHVADFPVMRDDEPEQLRALLKHFGNKAFLAHQAQGSEQYKLVKSCCQEE